jgi:tetratricopeptide (TPR) repeat protein
MYFALIMYSMMGYVLYQFHEQLGFSVEEEYQEDQAKQRKDIGDPRFRYIDILLQEGKVTEAEQKLIQAIKDNPGELEPREKLHRLYIATRNLVGLQQHSADYVVRLLHMKKPSEAMRVYLEAYHVTEEIKLKGAKERYELAELLKSNGQSRVALNLLNNLHQEYPSYEGIPAAYLLVAEIMFEYFSEEQKALQILDFLLKKYPGHPLQEKIKDYRQVVERMANTHPSA